MREKLHSEIETLAAILVDLDSHGLDRLAAPASSLYAFSSLDAFPDSLTGFLLELVELLIRLKTGQDDFDSGYQSLCLALDSFRDKMKEEWGDDIGETVVLSPDEMEEVIFRVEVLGDLIKALETEGLGHIGTIIDFCNALGVYDLGSDTVNRSIKIISKTADSIANAKIGLNDAMPILFAEVETLFDFFDIDASGDSDELISTASTADFDEEEEFPLDALFEEPTAPAVEPEAAVAPEVSTTSSPDMDIPVFDIDYQNPELLDFVTETREYLDNAEAALMELERRPDSKKLLHEVFRCMHNTKGISGFLNILDVQQLAHTAESMLDKARDGRLAFSPAIASAALDTVDLTREMVSRIERGLQGEPYQTPSQYSSLVSHLVDIITGEFEDPLADGAGDRKQEEPSGKETDEKSSPGEIKNIETEDIDLTVENEISTEPGNENIEDFFPIDVEEIKKEKKKTGPKPPNKKLDAVNGIIKQHVKLESFVKISTGRLDELIEGVGELVVANSMIKRKAEQEEDLTSEHVQNSTALDNITRSLQELAMSLRMVSLKPTFVKMSRIARDLAVKSNLDVDFTFSGEETEIDRNVVEEVTSPLVHMVRNAMDHGVASPEERMKMGKPRRGHIHLSAYHEGGSVVVKLEDDGRGLNREKILEKAIKMGIIASDAELKEKQIFDLIFEPGFSTAEKITDISGRGVGMDVVRKSIENLRGRIEIKSAAGEGTTFIIKLPITLAIIDGMMVRAGDEDYIIPTIAIKESLKPTPENLSTVVNEGEVATIRGELMPLLRLGDLLNIENSEKDPLEGLLIIIEDNREKYALMVDDLLGQQQVVIKALGKIIGRPQGIAGGAIIGDGSVALIIDPPGLMKMADN